MVERDNIGRFAENHKNIGDRKSVYGNSKVNEERSLKWGVPKKYHKTIKQY